MLHSMFQKMKEVLPPKVSFQLRAIKSGFVDRDLQELMRFAKAVGGPDVHAIDVGANYGIYSAAMSRYFSRVVVIEPNPDCVDYMQRVLPDRCQLISAAVSDVEGSTKLRIPLVAGAFETTRATISTQNAFDGLDLSGTRDIDVTVRSIDGLAREGIIALDRLRLIKIDVEGHELKVLSGAKNVLSTARPSICLELERRHGTQVNATLELLNELGYQTVRFDSGRYVTDEGHALGSDGAVNLFMVPKDRMQMIGIDPR
jgi:FkbM family methyltransferase